MPATAMIEPEGMIVDASIPLLDCFSYSLTAFPSSTNILFNPKRAPIEDSKG